MEPTGGIEPPTSPLPRVCSATELCGLPLLVEGVGFEPTKPFRTPDLQSGGLNHSPTPPFFLVYHIFLLYYSYLGLEPQRGFEPTDLSITSRLRYHCATGATPHQILPNKNPRFQRRHFLELEFCFII